jgi:cell wall-associated NlpC family hydrolase
MSYFVCVVAVCPVRAEPAHRSEQVSQLLFGESCAVLESSGDFVKVSCSYDSYDGWCQASQLQQVDETIALNVDEQLAANWINELTFNDKRMYIPFGSKVNTTDGFLGTNKVNYAGELLEPKKQQFGPEILEKIVFTFLNTPYLWGGRSVFGIDCSGFTQVVFKCLNIPLLRDASQQATQGDAIGFLMEAKCGDLAFFDNEAGKITHVGILLDANTIIHASGKVRIDTIDNFGIVNSDTGKRSHTLRVIKRLIY